MRVRFYLPIKPFSVNNMFYRDRRHKTQDYRDWEVAAIMAINTPYVQQQLAKIRESFDENKHSFVVRFSFFYPPSVLLTKSGNVSSRAEDLTNVEKPLLDLLFLPKYHVQTPPYGAQNINTDDKHVVRLTSGKAISKDSKHYTHVSIAIVPKPTLAE